MKYIIILALFIITINCKAQDPIVGLHETRTYGIPNGIYYKDIDGDLDKYVGTWKYTNGTTSLTITFRKILQYYNGKWYADKLIGDYKYIQNGVVIMNYLSRMNDPTVNNAQHYIKGNRIIYPFQVVDCDNCSHMERRIELYFSDPLRKYLSQGLVIRHINANGTEKIQANIRLEDLRLAPEGTNLEPRIPFGNYTLIKQ
ncbi:DUF6705 family protein [Kordia sp.]|uniref:DUF6705 family protein n=1 Tax=Kordia sp. TaxID=1965332 RepID=UPI003D2D9258